MYIYKYICIYICIYIYAIYRINNTIIQYGSGHKNEDLRLIYDYLIMENDGFGHAILELVHVLFIYI